MYTGGYWEVSRVTPQLKPSGKSEAVRSGGRSSKGEWGVSRLEELLWLLTGVGEGVTVTNTGCPQGQQYLRVPGTRPARPAALLLEWKGHKRP